MNRLRISARIALCLALLSLSVLLAASAVGLFPDPRDERLKGRAALCEALAIECSALTQKGDLPALELVLREVRARNLDLTSIGLRGAQGQSLLLLGPHLELWKPDLASDIDTQIYVPIMQNGATWGTLEFTFQTGGRGGWLAVMRHPLVRFGLFVGSLNCVVFGFYLARVLTQLDPAKAVPDRVRATLDTFVEGLIVLDDQGRIVLANKVFAETVGQSPDNLQGRRAAELPWVLEDLQTAADDALWRSSGRQIGVPLTLRSGLQDHRNFRVNVAPIRDDKGRKRGVLASFDDVTALEQKKRELLEMLDVLRLSRDKIQEQNQQLQILATRDSLTGCLNRRAFFEEFHKCWKHAERYKQPLSCVMVDVDHFKSVNDKHGHAMGDEVLRKVSAALLQTTRETDRVGRYGGEEFCVLLPALSVEEGLQAAERLRKVIADLEFPGLKVTASFGVSAISLGAANPQEMLDQADKSLYVAKRTGRNRAVRWDHVPPDAVFDEKKAARPVEAKAPQEAVDIPYHSVASLLAALSYRDPDTAAHSTRVADLCVATARDMLSVRETYILEIAALLHDIGKIGVPDSILLKPGPLTREEWEIMNLHARMGVEIVNASFGCQPLVDVVRFHHAPFGGDPSAPNQPRGEEIPLGARLVSIADAYDAMVSDRVYRKGRPREAAFAELRRSAGRQFDPKLVEAFIEAVSKREEQAAPAAALSQELALNLGMQMERLARALDDHDLLTVKALANHLEATSTRFGAENIAAQAAKLKRLSDSDTELTRLVQVMHELLDLCHAAQRVHIAGNEDCASVDQARRQAVEAGIRATAPYKP